MTVAQRKSWTDGKVEAKRRIIRQSLDETTAEVKLALRYAKLSLPVHIVVPSRHSLAPLMSGPNSAFERCCLAWSVSPVLQWRGMATKLTMQLLVKLGTELGCARHIFHLKIR